MKIRNIDLGEQPVVLAPMEDVTDPAFRLMCKRFGADMVYTEFVSADALIRSVNKTMAKLNIDEQERPVAIQIYGKDVPTMVEAAKIVEEAKPDILDINFGCPVKRVAGKGDGAGMLQNIPLLLEITKAVVDAVKIPVTVKTRLGWDHDHRIIVDLAEQLQDCGIEALTVHGRTRAQMYTGEADWTLIGDIKKNPRIHIPIIGNGDVTTPQRAKECFEKGLLDITQEQFDQLYHACFYHTKEHQTDNPTINTCYDADRLDLGRVGMRLDPKKMATNPGARIAHKSLRAKVDVYEMREWLKTVNL